MPPAFYASGCSELDDRVLGNDVTGRLAGGVVGISADDGDIGTSVALQVAVQHLRRDATATARLVTTRPMEQAVRLLKGVLRKEKDARAAILGRVLISRIYGYDDLQAVLGELEAGVPFQRLWSVGSGSPEVSTIPPSIVILTEMDHHFRWLRLQSQGAARVHELYGHLMRRLRGLAAGAAPHSAQLRPLVFVLNSTLTRVPDPRPEVNAPNDTTYRLALAALQQGRPVAGRPAAFRLCCDELARAQCTEPRHRALLNYYCSLHVCLTRLPRDLVDLWGGPEGDGSDNEEGSLWVGTVENDENELGRCMADRIGVLHYCQGRVQDALFP